MIIFILFLCVLILCRFKPRALKYLLQISHSTRPVLATLLLSLLVWFDDDGTVLITVLDHVLDSSSVLFSFSYSSSKMLFLNKVKTQS